jgi:hypothetical protein
MGTFSNYLCRNLLDILFGGGQRDIDGLSIHEVYNIALLTAEPAKSDTADSLVAIEADYEGYQRRSITSFTDGWDAAVDGDPCVKANKIEVQFTPCVGGNSTVRFFALLNEFGDLICWGPLDQDYIITDGVVPTFGAGSLVVTLT